MKDYLGYENGRNKRNAHVYERFLRRALKTDKIAVLVGHHITFELNGDLETENEIPSADTLMFDHDLMRAVFGEGYLQHMKALVTLDCNTREDYLKNCLDTLDHWEVA